MEKQVAKSNNEEGESNRFTFLSNPAKRKLMGSLNPSPMGSPSIQQRVPPAHGVSDVITPKKLLFQMDLFSPCKGEEVPKSTTPRNKRRFSDSHTGLTPGISQLLPTKAKKSRTSLGSLPKADVGGSGVDKSPPTLVSPIQSLFGFSGKDNEKEADIEMQPGNVFENSPGSPSYRASQCKEMLDDIDVSPDNSEETDFLKRPTNYNIRRCKSLEIRKKLLDMTNTPPSAFKKCLFKKPAPISEEKSPLIKEPKCSSSSEPPPIDLKEEATCESEDHQRIKQAVDVLHDTQNLIADGSRHYCLPLVKGKHSDLQSIDHETMGMLVSNRYPCVFDKLTTIDCRYPYEYEGGHIKGALNIYTEEAMEAFLHKEVKETVGTSSIHILVFHCEFSSQRGPSLLRHLRNCDRQLNMEQYPLLTFPEVYCLFGGYKEFYAFHPDLCEPSGYTLMVDEKHASDLRHFRAKAKSWAAGDRLKLKQQQSL